MTRSPVARRTRDLRRRRDHALDAAAAQLAREPISGRPRLVGRAHRPRQPGAERRRLADVAAQSKPLQLSRLGVERRRHDLGGVHIEADEGSSLRHGRLLLCGCGPPRGCQPRGKNITPRPSRGTGHFYIGGISI
ncbi:MAG: hypothetical protein LC777_07450 [Actinobacteria bacterium]|nr:hypothetical protein [Actinomycetota bacterium]